MKRHYVKHTEFNPFDVPHLEPELVNKAIALFLEDQGDLFHSLLVDSDQNGDKLILTFDFAKLTQEDWDDVKQVLEYD